MTLREKQSLFVILVARLIQYGTSLGYEFTFGEAYRSKEEAERLWRLSNGAASRNSLHTQRLAIDLNLFRDGKWLTKTEDHRELGEWWERQHPLCRWGGRFEDGNHYSIEHGGRK